MPTGIYPRTESHKKKISDALKGNTSCPQREAHYKWKGGISYEFRRKEWVKYHGMLIPEKCEVHHIDGDRTNNSILNLMLVSHGGHTKIHNLLQSRLRGVKVKKGGRR
uniref:Putative homing endonuclease n=1 Tax=viral metagenome TaxID=1070528 RepID=A0A6M3LGI6_9ZZZZ